jgi:hypothetical protein
MPDAGQNPIGIIGSARKLNPLTQSAAILSRSEIPRGCIFRSNRLPTICELSDQALSKIRQRASVTQDTTSLVTADVIHSVWSARVGNNATGRN